MIVLKNVLVATDFGEAAGVAVEYGRHLARTFGANLHVLHVVDVMRVIGGRGYGVDVNLLQTEAEASARVRLDAIVTEDDRRTLRARTIVRASPATAEEIVTYAEDANVDLIITGTHGRGALGHLFLGSVAERVVRTAPCPVLTVRHPEHDFLVPDSLQVVTHTTAG